MHTRRVWMRMTVCAAYDALAYEAYEVSFNHSVENHIFHSIGKIELKILSLL